MDTLGACAPDILQSTVGAGETVMDYRHIWAVISRSHIPPAFSRRQKSCIMVSHRRPGTLSCLVSVHVCIVSLLYLLQDRIKQPSLRFWLLCSKTFFSGLIWAEEILFICSIKKTRHYSKLHTFKYGLEFLTILKTKSINFNCLIDSPLEFWVWAKTKRVI